MAEGDKIKINWDDIKKLSAASGNENSLPAGSAPAPVVAPTSSAKRTRMLVFVLLGIIALVTAVVVLMTFHGEPSLRVDDLKVASLTVNGGWFAKGSASGASEAWSGSAFVVGQNEDGGQRHLRLVTNAHCLVLKHIREQDDYVLLVRTQTGRQQRATRMAIARGHVDLAFLDVPAADWVDGKDYVCVPHSKGIHFQEGDKVVAVGNPLGGYPGTQTSGEISYALRVLSDGTRWIQHTAATNHGNSGGPLFLLNGNRAFWVGVNTWVERKDGAEGLNFAIPSDLVIESGYEWAEADAAGARELASH